MSVESAKAFLERVKKDKDLQEQLKKVNSEEKFFAIVKASGFEFTKEEWPAEWLPVNKVQRLGESDLEDSAGADPRLSQRRGCARFVLWRMHTQAYCTHRDKCGD